MHWGWALDGLREVRKGDQGPQPQGGGGKDEGEYDDQEEEEEYEGEEEEVEMHFTNGHTARASFVVGCDGLHSSVRAALFGAEAPKFTGIVQVCPTHNTTHLKHLMLTRVLFLFPSQCVYYSNNIHAESRQVASPPSHKPTPGYEDMCGGVTLVQCYGLNAFFITIPVSADTRVWV